MAGEGGLDTFITVVIDSLHFESHLICTNCGPLGLKADVEPTTNRKALSDRSWAHMVPPASEDSVGGDVDFDLQTCSEVLFANVSQFRVHSCLTAYVLCFLKHIPSCRPNLTYANMLTNKWFEMLDLEYNIEKPSKRKLLKLRMMFEVFCVESAVYEKFEVAESGLDYADMQPDEDGNLAPFVIEMLADVVRSLQRCLDLEVIVTAWSHSLDHSTQTCAHMHQMMATISGLVGNDFDRRTLEGTPPLAPHPASAGAPAAALPQQAQGLAAEENEYDQVCGADDAIDQMMGAFEAGSLQMLAPPGAPAAANPAAQPAAPLGPRGEADHAEQEPPPQVPPPPPPPQVPPPLYNDRGPPNNENNQPTMSTAVVKEMMRDGKTRKECLDFAHEMEVQRQCRSEMSNRALSKKLDSRCDAHQQLTKLFTDGIDQRNKEPMHRMKATGQVISAKRAAGACMPTVADVISRGMTEGFLKNIVSGLDAKQGDFAKDEAQVGTSLKTQGWEYKRLTDASLPGPADFDFGWARLRGFSKASDASGGGGGGGDGKNKKSLWTNTAKVIKQATKSALTTTFTMMDSTSMSLESMRDTMYLMLDEKKRIPQFNHGRRFDGAETSRMLSKNQIFSEVAPPSTIHPHCMYADKDPSGQPKLDTNFLGAQGIARPIGSTVSTSPYQKRLDHLTQHRALPACIAPESFKKGAPIEECESFNGVYINKHVASEQANLVVEMAHYLSTVPGIAGGWYTHVPDSFKSMSARKRADTGTDNGLEQNMQEASTPAAVDATRSVSEDEPAADPAESEGEEAAKDSDSAFVVPDNEPADALPVAEGDDCDMHPVERSVSNPDSDELPITPGAGAAAASAAAAADPNAMQNTLPYEWDQFAMFMTCKAIDTLHNDCRPHVEKVRRTFGDVFEEESINETMAGLPQICMRFPGLKEKNKLLFPLSRGMATAPSRFCDMESHLKQSRASKELTEAVHSMANGRAMDFNDPEVAEHEAEVHGVDTGFSMSGNLFARSTWQRFTLSALETRGMLTDGEVGRVNDQGLCLRWRVRNHRAAECHADAFPWLDVQKPAPARSFDAQERRKRKGGQDSEVDVDRYGSVAAKKRALEQTRSKDLISDSLDAPVMA